MSLRFIFPITLICLLLFVAGCANMDLQPNTKNVIIEERAVDTFDTISICCGIQLELTQDTQTTVALEGAESVLRDVETTVRDNQLTVQMRPRFRLLPRFRSNHVTVYISLPELQSLELSGGSKATADMIQSTQLLLDLSGGSRLNFASLEADHLTADLSGGAGITIESGVVTTQMVNAGGGSQYLVAEVKSGDAEIDLSGGSRARLWAAETLRVDASGGSTLSYRGSPTVAQDISGGSHVRSVGE